MAELKFTPVEACGAKVTMADMPIDGSWHLCRIRAYGALAVARNISETKADVRESLTSEHEVVTHHPSNLNVVDKDLLCVWRRPSLPDELAEAPVGSFWEVKHLTEVYALVGETTVVLFDGKMNPTSLLPRWVRLVPIRQIGTLQLE
jgi:hypothetical protein